jgi:hypothetical protein
MKATSTRLQPNVVSSLFICSASGSLTTATPLTQLERTGDGIFSYFGYVVKSAALAFIPTFHCVPDGVFPPGLDKVPIHEFFGDNFCQRRRLYVHLEKTERITLFVVIRLAPFLSGYYRYTYLEAGG